MIEIGRQPTSDTLRQADRWRDVAVGRPQVIGSGKQTAGGGERQADRWFVVKAVGRPLWVAVGRPLEKATYQTSSGATTGH